MVYLATIFNEVIPINLAKRITMACIGFALIGFAVAALRLIGLGIDPLGAMTLGFSYLTGLSFGTVLLLIHLPVFVVMYWKTRGFIGIGTVIGMVGIGYATDFFFFLGSFFAIAELPLALRLGLLVFTVVIFAFGIAIYTVAAIGMVPFDAIGMIAEELTGGKIKFKWGRLGMDAISAFTAFLLGAPLGVATLLAVAGLGPLISWFRQKIKP